MVISSIHRNTKMQLLYHFICVLLCSFIRHFYYRKSKSDRKYLVNMYSNGFRFSFQGTSKKKLTVESTCVKCFIWTTKKRRLMATRYHLWVAPPLPYFDTKWIQSSIWFLCIVGARHRHIILYPGYIKLQKLIGKVYCLANERINYFIKFLDVHNSLLSFTRNNSFCRNINNLNERPKICVDMERMGAAIWITSV